MYSYKGINDTVTRMQVEIFDHDPSGMAGEQFTMDGSDINMQELIVDGVFPPNYNLQLQLFEATRKGDLSKVRSLCQLNCDLRCVDSSGKTLFTGCWISGKCVCSKRDYGSTSNQWD